MQPHSPFCLGLTLHSTQTACHNILTDLNPRESPTAFQGMLVGGSRDLNLCEQEHWLQSPSSDRLLEILTSCISVENDLYGLVKVGGLFVCVCVYVYSMCLNA